MSANRIAISAALLAASLTSAANAADWAREIGGWNVGRTEDMCMMVKEFEGSGATEVTLFSDGNGSEVYLTIDNYNWSAKKDEAYRLKHSLGDWDYTLPSVGTAESSGYGRKGFIAKLRDDYLADFAKSSSLTIMLGDVLVDDLNLSGSGAALSALRACAAELAREAAKAERDRKRLEHIPTDPFAEAAKKAGNAEK